MTIPVVPESEILPGDVNLLAILKWRLQSLMPSNRWYPVLQRYIGVVSQRILGMGKNPGSIIGSPLGGFGQGEIAGRCPEPPAHSDHLEFTGKIVDLRFDRFGDFEGFDLLTLAGEEHRFDSRELRVETLAREAWAERILLSVIVPKRRPRWPAEIILRRR
jgi:hypothetical protein